MSRATELTSQLAEAFRGYRFSFVDEYELQLGVANVLEDVNAPFRKEYQLSGKDRLDFFVPVALEPGDDDWEPAWEGVAIEVKISGSLTDLTMQVHRYMQSEEVVGVVIVTPKLRLTRMPAEINGKPLRVAHLASSAF